MYNNLYSFVISYFYSFCNLIWDSVCMSFWSNVFSLLNIAQNLFVNLTSILENRFNYNITSFWATSYSHKLTSPRLVVTSLIPPKIKNEGKFTNIEMTWSLTSANECRLHDLSASKNSLVIIFVAPLLISNSESNHRTD